MALLDLRMPELNGLEVLRTIRSADAPCEVVLMSGDPTLDSAVEAVKLGALDYLQKPLDLGRLEAILSGVREDNDRRRRVLAAEGALARDLEVCGMIGRSAVMQELFRLIRRLAPHVRTALITGETGTGKELVAAALHRLGPRHARRFITINCSAVVETLFESELFGHVRGAFTGAVQNKPGLFELADGGTLFLDEIGELPLGLQAKLLRVLEQGQVQRVGSLEARTVDVHVLAATNRNLLAEADAGRFRRDLYYRLNVVELAIPPLRERREDIPYLVASFVRDSAQKLNKPIAGLTSAAEGLLFGAAWDGNVRELRNLVERACIMADGEFLSVQDVTPANARGSSPPHNGETSAAQRVGGLPRRSVAKAGDSPDRLSDVERDHIVSVLRSTHGNKAQAARVLGVSRRALYRRLERLGLSESNDVSS
jgi:DNA-binding NtrC family response regulator